MSGEDFDRLTASLMLLLLAVVALALYCASRPI